MNEAQKKRIHIHNNIVVTFYFFYVSIHVLLTKNPGLEWWVGNIYFSHVDVRLLAKQSIAFKAKDMIKIPNDYSQLTLPNSLESVVDQCELTG